MENLEEKKKDYEAPFTRKTQLELEEGICAVGSATVTNPNNDHGKINPHEVNQDFNGDFSGSNWTDNLN